MAYRATIERNPKFIRDPYAREYYFYHKKGHFDKIYFCPYCGKLMWKKSQMEVDHIYAIHKVQKNKRLRRHFEKYERGVNTLDNLVAACVPCNRRKGAKGGLWIFLGKYGVHFMPVLRMMFFLTLILWVVSNHDNILHFYNQFTQSIFYISDTLQLSK